MVIEGDCFWFFESMFRWEMTMLPEKLYSVSGNGRLMNFYI